MLSGMVPLVTHFDDQGCPQCFVHAQIRDHFLGNLRVWDSFQDDESQLLFPWVMGSTTLER